MNQSSTIIIVSPLNGLQDLVATSRPSHVLTLLSPDGAAAPAFALPPERHLKLYFHDINESRPGLIAPTPDMVRDIVAFGRSWTMQQPLLIHCWAGISRSSAAAFMLACDMTPNREVEIAENLRHRAPTATPNPLMIQYADALLGADGRMVAAIAAIGRGAEAFEGTPYQLPVPPPAIVPNPTT